MSPDDFPAPGREAQRKLRMGRLGMDEVHRPEPQWCTALRFGQLSAGNCRIEGKTKSANQRQQGLVGNLMAMTECVRVMGRDTKEPGKLNDRSAIVDVCHAYSGVRSSAGSAPSEGTILDANAGLRGDSCRGARLMNSANEWACSRYTSPGA